MAENEQATIECEFAFKCPKTWNQLAKTAQENVRFCSECQREVYLIQTDDELRKHSAKGHCIAAPLTMQDFHSEEEEIGYAVGRVKTLYNGRWI